MVDVSFVHRGRCIMALKYLHSGRKCQGIASSIFVASVMNQL